MLLTTNRKKKRICRGGARGKRGGRGHKGQKSRAGHRIRPALRDQIQRIPKRRGYNKNRSRGIRGERSARSVTLAVLNRNFKEGDRVTPEVLVSKRIISRIGGKTPGVKVVSRGAIAIPLAVRKCGVSAGAKQKIEAAGGTVQ